jgi:hypothetical protein
MQPAKRQKRNVVEAIDHAGAEPVRAPDSSLPRKRGEVKTVRGLCLSARWQPQDKVTKQHGVATCLGWVVSWPPRRAKMAMVPADRARPLR